MTDDHVPLAIPDDLGLSVRWDPPEDDGTVSGEVIARNVGGRTVRLAGKPALVLVDGGGRELDNGHVVTAEARFPGHVDLAPGQSARASVLIAEGHEAFVAASAGTELSAEVIVEWRGGRAPVRADAAPRSESPTGRWQTTSGWWSLA